MAYKAPENGTVELIDGKECVFYDGYWIRFYPVPEDTLANRKQLIDSLTRRAFHHTESGINTPGDRLEEARAAYEAETDPSRKRVNGAMLAGALFNRASDIFNAVVELESKGVRVSRGNELMKQCSQSFREALDLGKLVKHYSGHEGIDELWGEPFKAFTQPIASVFESRYRKIAQTMRDIDLITDQMTHCFQREALFQEIIDCIQTYGAAAKQQIETMKQDESFFTVWPTYIASRECLEQFAEENHHTKPCEDDALFQQGVKLVTSGTDLITYISEARVPMPKSTHQFMQECEAYMEARKTAAN